MYNKFLVTLLLFTAFAAINSTYAQKSETPQELVVKFLDIVEEKAYMSPTVNWDSVRPAFIGETKHITEPKELRILFQKFLRQLKDYHSGVFYAESQTDEDTNEHLIFYATATYEEQGAPPLNFQHEFINEKYGYINIPPVVLEQKRYIETIGNQLKELDRKNPKAWIFDLTENEGGSRVPMLWPMYYLIDQDEVYSDVDSKGKEEKVKKMMWDTTGEDEDGLMFFELAGLGDEKLIPKEMVNTNIPIIILTSEKTASSGEFFVAAFKGQRNVTVIGQKTSGLTSGNEAINLSKNYLLNLTTSVIKDRTGKVYKIGEGIDPDISVEIERGLSAEDYMKPEVKQKFLDAAIKFLDKL